MNDLAEKICRQTLTCGFDKCGIIPISAVDDYERFYEKRMKDVPESRGMYTGLLQGMDTRERFAWAKSIVVLVAEYGNFRFPKELQGRYGKALFLEPEITSKERLDFGGLEKWFAENGIRAEQGCIGPLRNAAIKTGLGIIRKNNFFYTEKGSYNNLYAFVIDVECELIYKSHIVPCSEKCDLCQRACKTHALSSPYTINPLKCVSALTTFGACEVPEGLSDEMYEEWMCGCDNCQDACPHNRRHDWSQGKPLPELEEIASIIVPENFVNLSDDFLVQNVIPKSANHLKEKDLPALRKNAARSAKNHR